ncbi:MAG: hypothetical protein AAF578_00255 [Pseudomonadota bacterium]
MGINLLEKVIYLSPERFEQHKWRMVERMVNAYSKHCREAGRPIDRNMWRSVILDIIELDGGDLWDCEGRVIKLGL